MTELQNITLNELKRDGITTEVLESLSEKDRTILIVEYAKSAMKRFDNFRVCLQTQPQAKKAFNRAVLEMI